MKTKVTLALVFVAVVGSFLSSCGPQSNDKSRISAVADIRSLSKNADGTFLVVCEDGSVEQKVTEQQIVNQQVCKIGISSDALLGTWTALIKYSEGDTGNYLFFFERTAGELTGLMHPQANSDVVFRFDRIDFQNGGQNITMRYRNPANSAQLIVEAALDRQGKNMNGTMSSTLRGRYATFTASKNAN